MHTDACVMIRYRVSGSVFYIMKSDVKELFM
jgi:hypothetical protein